MTNPWLGIRGVTDAPAVPSESSDMQSPDTDRAWVLLVVGTEHRVGASVTSLAITEACSAVGLDVLLIDAAVPRWSGLRAALEAEGPRVRPGLAVCQGRRGDLPVRSMEREDATVTPADFLIDTESRDLVVVDTGATLAGATAWLSVVDAWLPVAALTTPGLARAEAALHETALMTDTAPAGLSGIATSLDPRTMAGPRLGRALERQWVPMPRRGDVEAAGASPAPLPGQLVEAAGRLVQGMMPEDLAARIPAPSQRGFWRRNR